MFAFGTLKSIALKKTLKAKKVLIQTNLCFTMIWMFMIYFINFAMEFFLHISRYHHFLLVLYSLSYASYLDQLEIIISYDTDTKDFVLILFQSFFLIMLRNFSIRNTLNRFKCCRQVINLFRINYLKLMCWVSYKF